MRFYAQKLKRAAGALPCGLRIRNCSEAGVRVKEMQEIIADLEDEVCRLNWLVAAESDIRHGEWVHGREISRTMIGDEIIEITYEEWHCSKCGFVVGTSSKRPMYNYCPSCGARMDGGAVDGMD